MWEIYTLEFCLDIQKAIKAPKSEDVPEKPWFSECSSMGTVRIQLWNSGKNTTRRIR